MERTSFAIAGLFWALYAATGCQQGTGSTIRLDTVVPEGTAGREALLEVQSRLGITIEAAAKPFVYQAIWGSIRGGKPSVSAVRAYAPRLLEEISRYSVPLVRAGRLTTIVLCDGLKVAGQGRAAVPIFDEGRLYLDVERGAEPYQRRVIHHEFFHMVDMFDDGGYSRDPYWESLNPRGFRYGDGGASMQDDERSGAFEEDLAGFLTRYATAAVEEDKAEIFSFLMTEPVRVDAKAAGDAVLAEKVRWMRDFAALLGMGL